LLFACLSGYGVGVLCVTILDVPLNLKFYLIESAFLEALGFVEKGGELLRKTTCCPLNSWLSILFNFLVGMNQWIWTSRFNEGKEEHYLLKLE
jgi:hypothetical protein